MKRQPRLKVAPRIAEIPEDLPPGLEADAGFMRVFRFLEDTREHAFITGEAGTGKSTLLRYFRSRSAKNVVVLAPTGVAAINVGGQTIHSFFRFPFHYIHRSDIKKLRDHKLIESLDTLVIDEASMLRADMLDAMDYSLRLHRGRMKEAFGGVQLVFFGDLFQLPPVLDDDVAAIVNNKYENPYFFQAEVFDYIRPKYIVLDRVFRQSDRDFIGLLRRIRGSECEAEDMAALNERVKRLDPDEGEHTVTLTTTNADARRINEYHLGRLPGKVYGYTAAVEGDFDPRTVVADERLLLKRGAQVMMLKNDPDKRWVNGTIARVADLDDSTIQVDVAGQVYDVPMGAWEKLKYSFNEAEDKVEHEIVGMFHQFPVKLAWAITIHKSQGQTFNELHIDLGRGTFAHGQLYVALSRCRTLDGITLRRPVAPSDLIFDERIFGFQRRFEKWDLK